jgi:hypothetical protein
VSPAQKVTQVSLVPALLTGGTHDPITPPSWARRAAASLAVSTVALFPGYGHAVLSTGDPCLLEMLRAFYANPAQPPPTACLAGRTIDWYVAP